MSDLESIPASRDVKLQPYLDALDAIATDIADEAEIPRELLRRPEAVDLNEMPDPYT